MQEIRGQPAEGIAAARASAVAILEFALLLIVAVAGAIVYAGRRRLAAASRELLDSERRHDSAREALAASEERLRLVLRGSNDAAWDWDLEKNELFYSPRWWEMLGYEPGELPGDAGLWRRLIHSDDAARVDELMATAGTDSSTSFEVEFRMRHKAGHYVPVLSRGFILRDGSGKAVRVSGTDMDLTERVRVETALRRSEVRMRALTNRLTTRSSRPISTGTSSAGTRVRYGCSGTRRARSAAAVLTLIPPRHRAAHIDGMARVRSGGALQTMDNRALELEALRKDGREFPVELTVARWENDEGSFVTSIMRDVDANEVQERPACARGVALSRPLRIQSACDVGVRPRNVAVPRRERRRRRALRVQPRRVPRHDDRGHPSRRRTCHGSARPSSGMPPRDWAPPAYGGT